MTKIQQLNTSLQLAVANALTGYHMSDLLANRATRLVEQLRAHYNEDLIIHEVVERMITQVTTNPAIMLDGSIVKDGVIYPEIQDEVEADTIIAETLVYIGSLGPEGAATVAALSLWASQAKHHLKTA